MTAYILGAGASAHAGYPLASTLLQGLSEWLDRKNAAEAKVPERRNRILQVRQTFGSLDDFEGILEKLNESGATRHKPAGPTTYGQNPTDIGNDCIEEMRGHRTGMEDTTGFYPHALRADLISAFRDYFYEIEASRTAKIAYDRFARNIEGDALIVTLNYDVALERALAKQGKWDIGTGYGFTTFRDRKTPTLIVYKLHGSVNWFQLPDQDNVPPLMFSRDLKLLGYHDLADPRVPPGDDVPIDNSGTLIGCAT